MRRIERMQEPLQRQRQQQKHFGLRHVESLVAHPQEIIWLIGSSVA
jgi:hypothetical protein